MPALEVNRLEEGPIPLPRSKLILSLAALALTALPAEAKAGDPKITVMTRNVFIGASLAPGLEARSIPEAIDGAGTIWNEHKSTKFRERSLPLAHEIKRANADLVGLQEVALWRMQPSDGGAPPISPIPGAKPATTVEQDFLAILRRKLRKIGAGYRVAAVQREFDAELPADLDGQDATGTGPLAGFGADVDVRLTTGNAILVRNGSGVELGRVRMSHYKTRFEANVGGISIPVDRGWVSVDARLRGSRFRFLDTHLEAFGETAIREAQARDLIAGPLDTRRQVILVGDLNSGVARHNEPEKPGDDLAFRALADFGMNDNGAVQSCCYDSLFDPNATFDHTVDHILTKPRLDTLRAFVTGKDPGERTRSGLWPSDHGGVVSRLRLNR